ncbi:pentapeptide repeat-containing protein [Paenibacillus sp. FSL H7-0350]|uniref:pentapeptide repeat-containing protein n=1 Tax=Paenibacillus sp. FSL H7-0350 TaxID=2975345 RepID=UPI0031588184
MSNKIEPPRITDPGLLTPQDIHALASKDEFSNCLIEGALIEYQEATRVAFDKTIFKNVTITESSLQRIELTDVIFDHCDLSNVDFSDAFIHRTEFRDCRMIGTDFTRARFQNVSITGCIGEFAVFRFANFKGTSFERSSLVSADYYQSTLNGLYLAECNLEQATLAGCKLKGVDLSDCEFTGLLVDLQDLEGCIISAEQAASFAGLLGLVIKS